MKKTTTLCIIACALTSSSISFGMLVKKTIFTKQLIRNTHTQDKHKENYLQKILEKNKIYTNYYFPHHTSASLKEMRYTNNDELINILKKQINYLQQNLRMIKTKRNFIHQCLQCNAQEIEKLEKKLYTNLKTEYINKYLQNPNNIKSSE